jgi:hypothetical protein
MDHFRNIPVTLSDALERRSLRPQVMNGTAMRHKDRTSVVDRQTR